MFSLIVPEILTDTLLRCYITIIFCERIIMFIPQNNIYFDLYNRRGSNADLVKLKKFNPSSLNYH